MDWLTFLAQVIQALAWPLTVIVIFLMLRRPLAELFPTLQRLRFWDIEMDFDRQVQALAIRVRDELPPLSAVEETASGFREHLVELANLSPRAVVLEAWLQLEKAAIEATRRHGLDLPSRELRAPIFFGEALEAAGVLDADTQLIYHRLRNLRNAAAHASDFAFDPGSALEYADLALRLAEHLRKA